MTDDVTTPDEGAGPTMTPDEMRADLLSQAAPLEGLPLHEREYPDDDPMGAAYVAVVGSLARALIETGDADPTLWDVTKENAEDPSGFAAADNRKLWEAAKERYPGLNDWLGGITGFQWGVAHQSARYACGADSVGNPAIVTVEVAPQEGDLSVGERTALAEGARRVLDGEDD